MKSAADVLEALVSRGVALSVLTNKPEGMSRAILAGMGLDRLFLAIILLAIIGKTTDSILGVFERWAVRRWA